MILGIRTNPQTRREGVNISRRKKMRNGVKFLPDRVISCSCLQRVAVSTTVTDDATASAPSAHAVTVDADCAGGGCFVFHFSSP